MQSLVPASLPACASQRLSEVVIKTSTGSVYGKIVLQDRNVFNDLFGLQHEVLLLP